LFVGGLQQGNGEVVSAVISRDVNTYWKVTVRREQTSESVRKGRKWKGEGGTEDLSETDFMNVKWENRRKVALKWRNWDNNGLEIIRNYGFSST
jgi:hypothetical protein